MSLSLKPAQDQLEHENRSELERVLGSPNFRRAPSLSKFLSYICESYFSGHAGELKEYNIAVSALGRRPGFDPQVDPIVRVSAHSLRKRLDSYYQGEGRFNPVRIVLPVGSYIPAFHKLSAEERKRVLVLPAVLEVADTPQAPPEKPEDPLDALKPEVDSSADRPLSNGISPPGESPLQTKPQKWPTIFAVLAVFIGISAYALFLHHREANRPVASNLQENVAAPFLALRLGSQREWADHAGQTWSADSYCHGGSRFENKEPKLISGVSDPEIVAQELTGNFHCAFPVSPGAYELHLYFADLSGAPVAAHRTFLLVNGQQYKYDIIADSEGTGRAVIKVLIDVKPASDGSIHLDAGDDQSFLSAVEIYRGVPGKMLPLRISASAISYVDSTGVGWLSDRYFVGGSQLQRSLQSLGADRPRLYQWERYGRFSYYLPVVENKSYTVTLYFSEGYFGRDKLVSGGPGSRIFDVYADGRTLLKNFDILSEAPPGHDPVVKTFHGIEPLNDGILELEFEPIHDYALVNAIEVTPE